MRGIELDIVGAGDNGANVRVRIAPPGFMGQRREWPLDTRALDAPGQNPVRATGEALLRRLEQANGEIATAIAILLGLPPAETNPLYLRIADEQAATLPWETLYVNGDFIALQPPWPIVRIADPAGRLTEREFVTTPELRIVAVLSALGQPALDEWVAIRKAAAEARDASPPLDVKLSVLVGEPELKGQIDQEVAQGADFVSVATIPPTVSQLLTRLEDEKPHLLHLYCHGSVQSSGPRLHFGTIAEWAARAQGTGSLNVAIAPLTGMAVNASSWLVVINACQGGADTTENYSLASELVRQGLPAAIGHRRPISPADAHRFAGALYPSLFRLIAKEFAVGGQREIEWAEALHAPRSGLDAFYGDPENSELWSLPILHVGEVPFKVKLVPAGDPAAAVAANVASGTAGTLAEAMRSVATLDVPPQVVDELLQPLDPEPAAELRELVTD